MYACIHLCVKSYSNNIVETKKVTTLLVCVKGYSNNIVATKGHYLTCVCQGLQQQYCGN